MQIVRVRCKLESGDYAAGKLETLREPIISVEVSHRNPNDVTYDDRVRAGPQPSATIL